MKQRYTITIADMEVNIVSDGSPEAIESLVNNVDRKMRELLLANRRCSKAEAALLCALGYCSDKIDAMRKQKQLEASLDMKDAELRSAKKELDGKDKELEKLRLELETMRESLLAAQAQQREAALSAADPVPSPSAETETAVQVTLEETLREVEAEAAEETTPAAEEAPVEETPAEEAPAEVETPVEETPAEVEEPAPAVAPEDVEFDPTEIFRRAKANRGLRKSTKRR